MADFEIGEAAEVSGLPDKGGSLNGLVGIVRAAAYGMYLVQFFGRRGLHTGNSEKFTSKVDDCWWIADRQLRKVEPEEQGELDLKPSEAAFAKYGAREIDL